ncbi:hypothetical protein Mapa_005835 [Marchantia paleacea]|nr:hypothetical protein Mapa_005835 [Marchantia paleacea]
MNAFDVTSVLQRCASPVAIVAKSYPECILIDLPPPFLAIARHRNRTGFGSSTRVIIQIFVRVLIIFLLVGGSVRCITRLLQPF